MVKIYGGKIDRLLEDIDVLTEISTKGIFQNIPLFDISVLAPERCILKVKHIEKIIFAMCQIFCLPFFGLKITYEEESDVFLRQITLETVKNQKFFFTGINRKRKFDFLYIC